MIHIGSLILMTRKELLDLLVVEKRTSYRRGYKAGAAMRYRHTPETSAQVTDENAMPTVYGDSLPIKPMPEVVVTINGEPVPIDATPKVVYEEPIQGC
jgi:hypothetical protein